MTPSIAEAISEAVDSFQRAGLADARREASGLVQHIIGRDRTFVLAHPEHCLSEEQLQRLRELIERRAAGEPMQYLTARQSFYGRDFEVDEGVLIPRPETELLVESALDLLPETLLKPNICDVGTGSGCIAITLLLERPQVTGVAIDISSAALAIAKRNAETHSVSDRLNFVLANCFSGLSADSFAFDLIASNPPYVADQDLAGLQREVRDHEPREALSGGPDGLDVVRSLLIEAPIFLKSEGFLLMEIGFSQAAAVKDLIDQKTWRFRDIRADLQGIPRVVILQKRHG